MIPGENNEKFGIFRKKENIKRFNETVGTLTKYDFTDRVKVDTPNFIKKVCWTRWRRLERITARGSPSDGYHRTGHNLY